MVYTGKDWYDWVFFPSLSDGALCLCRFFNDTDLDLVRISNTVTVTCNIEMP